ncbi:MAG: hypothetical protein WA840_08790, partial [Caulobacteraceae bacterium]
MQAAAEAAVRVHADNVAALAGLRTYVTEAANNLQARIEGLKQSVDREADANLSRHAPPVEPTMPHDRAETSAPLTSGPMDDDTLGPLERAGGA